MGLVASVAILGVMWLGVCSYRPFKPKLSSTLVGDDRTTPLETCWCPNPYSRARPPKDRRGPAIERRGTPLLRFRVTTPQAGVRSRVRRGNRKHER